MPADWIDRFEGLADLPDATRALLMERGKVMRVPKGAALFAPGMEPVNLLLLLEGTIRVQRSSDGGREIVLYRVEGGESCVMTSACLIAHEEYAAEGIAETEVTAVAVPRGVFDELVATSRPFRDFVFRAYARRITDLFHVIDEIAFGRIDVRLAERLLTLARDGDEVHATHQQLAHELGTAREVVSRQLTEFQRRGWIGQARGRVTLTDRAALTTLAG
ncbi:MAG: Crp/Fnr family transcriptional regulator [Rhodobacteraceae bacterium]|nr:Crp/Fnr family transcriptional regulator [Paracoccaceae bacterium]